MHPALSVIFFTAASGAGYGLLAWAAAAALTGAMPARVLLVAVVVGLVLVTAGLASSFLHLGKPMRAWRAFSQWRTSWLSREGVASALTYFPVLGLALALLPGALDGTPLPATRGDAVGLPRRQVTRFEGPTTEANYITREMGFVLARRHARTLRIAAVMLFSVVPLACIAIAYATGSQSLLVPAAIAAVSGAFVERWLFFAQARHVVTLYY